MIKNKKILYILIAVIIFVVWLIVFKYIPYRNSSVVTMVCREPNNASGKNNLPIPCSQNSDCDLSDKNVKNKMESFCNPAKVNYMKCGFRDFCGKDGYCRHDCNIYPANL